MFDQSANGGLKSKAPFFVVPELIHAGAGGRESKKIARSRRMESLFRRFVQRGTERTGEGAGKRPEDFIPAFPDQKGAFDFVGIVTDGGEIHLLVESAEDQDDVFLSAERAEKGVDRMRIRRLGIIEKADSARLREELHPVGVRREGADRFRGFGGDERLFSRFRIENGQRRHEIFRIVESRKFQIGACENRSVPEAEGSGSFFR